jgi:ABC-type phosphate transport system ATPase subunit
MQQAGRDLGSDCFLPQRYMIIDPAILLSGARPKDIFFNPKDARTEAYISGRFG